MKSVESFSKKDIGMLTKIAFLSEFDDSINQMLTLRKVGLIKKRIRRILFIIKQKSFSFKEVIRQQFISLTTK